MKIELHFIDGTIKRGIDCCLCVENTPTAVFVYRDFQHYIDQLPDQYDGVKTVVVWDDNMKSDDVDLPIN